MQENQNQENKPKGPVYEFKLPPDSAEMPILNAKGIVEAQQNFDEHITKKEFNFYLVNNLKPLIGMVFGLIAEVEKLRLDKERREEFNQKFDKFKETVDELQTMVEAKVKEFEADVKSRKDSQAGNDVY